MSKKSLIQKTRKKKEPINIFDDKFLKSKDIALQPITIFFEISSELEEIPSKTRYLSLEHIPTIEKGKISDRSKKSGKSRKSKRSSQKSEKSEKSEKSKSQKSTNVTNKKNNKRKSYKDSEKYNSNVVIVHHDDDCSSTDPIEKEVAKLKRLLSKSKEKKKRK